MLAGKLVLFCVNLCAYQIPLHLSFPPNCYDTQIQYSAKPVAESASFAPFFHFEFVFHILLSAFNKFDSLTNMDT